MNNMRGQKMSTRTFNKPKNKKKTLKRLGNYISEFKGWFILAITLTIISNLFSINHEVKKYDAAVTHNNINDSIYRIVSYEDEFPIISFMNSITNE